MNKEVTPDYRRLFFTFTAGDANIIVKYSRYTDEPKLYKMYEDAVVSRLYYYPQDIVRKRLERVGLEFVIDGELPDDEALAAAFMDAVECISDAVPQSLFTADTTQSYLSDWIDDLKKDALLSLGSERVVGEQDGMQWIEFSGGSGFYGRYRRTDAENPVLLVSLPCYSAQWNDLTPYLDLPCDILQISPFGYTTPDGMMLEKRCFGAWPVLFDTVMEIDEDKGYRGWLRDCIVAITRKRRPGQKIVFIGTSQGGGTSLVMSGIMRDITIACAAEMPFLIGFSGKNYDKVKRFVGAQPFTQMKSIYDFIAREHLFVADPVSYTRLIDIPVLVVSGGRDDQCPPQDIAEFVEGLICEKKYVHLPDALHGYTPEFQSLAVQWIKDIIDKYKEGE